MSEPDKHHYLPVFYLSRWSRLDGRVIRYYRPYRAVVASPIAPKETGYERGLYRLEGYAPDVQNTIEKKFMARVVDDPAAHALDTLIKGDNSKLTPEHRQAWTRFVVSLHARNPGKVEHITSQADHELRQSLLTDPGEYEAIRGVDDPPTLVQWVEQNAPKILNNFGKQLLPGIITHPPIVDAIIRMHWWTIDIADSFPDLLTCDRPVYMSHGVMDDRCLIALPLSPRFVFIATRSQSTFERVMARGIKSIAELINESMVMQAEKYVYGAHDRHLHFVENRLS
ncbi:MAG: hypothetical protein A2040_02005 [Rhodocyclales bacterium GWA2_65_19]|nr:MAG: hypothetical protein A2040_02005 [Rhodocyclales bacterium GWA2_65_19]